MGHQEACSRVVLLKLFIMAETFDEVKLKDMPSNSWEQANKSGVNWLVDQDGRLGNRRRGKSAPESKLELISLLVPLDVPNVDEDEERLVFVIVDSCKKACPQYLSHFNALCDQAARGTKNLVVERTNWKLLSCPDAVSFQIPQAIDDEAPGCLKQT